MHRQVLALLFAACGPGEAVVFVDSDLEAGTEAEALKVPVAFSQNAFGVTFSNADGSWVIYTRCYGPRQRDGQNLTVGPGYVARLTARKNGERLVEDETPAFEDWKYFGLSWPGTGGLGAFGWHHARVAAPTGFLEQGSNAWATDGHNTWEIAGRLCAEDHGGFGVSRAEVIDGPRLDAQGVGELTIDVFFSDAWTYPEALMKVRYQYRVRPSVVTATITATQLCGDGSCGAGAPGPAFLKEPKVKAGVRGGGYSRLAIFDEAGQLATNASGASCLYQGQNPRASTGQCDADGRARARFDFGTLTSGADGRCGVGGRDCLNVVMRSAAGAWEGRGEGFDAWAVAAAARAAVATKDTGAGDSVGGWSCYGSPAAQKNRRWESTGWERVSGAYTEAGFGFHAWEGGTGAYDCEPLARRFGPANESFTVFAQYSLGAGWTL